MPEMPMSREDFISTLGEGFHTAMRKGTDAPESAEIHRLITAMAGRDWANVLDLVAYGFEVTYDLTWAEEAP